MESLRACLVVLTIFLISSSFLPQIQANKKVLKNQASRLNKLFKSKYFNKEGNGVVLDDSLVLEVNKLQVKHRHRHIQDNGSKEGDRIERLPGPSLSQRIFHLSLCKTATAMASRIAILAAVLALLVISSGAQSPTASPASSPKASPPTAVSSPPPSKSPAAAPTTTATPPSSSPSSSPVSSPPAPPTSSPASSPSAASPGPTTTASSPTSIAGTPVGSPTGSKNGASMNRAAVGSFAVVALASAILF